MVITTSIIVGEDFIEGGVDLWIDVGLRFDLTLDLVENLEAVMMLTKVKLLFSLSDTAKEDSVFVGGESLLSLI